MFLRPLTSLLSDHDLTPLDETEVDDESDDQDGAAMTIIRIPLMPFGGTFAPALGSIFC